MTRILTGALAMAAFAAYAGAAQAANVCQWTGSDWACGNGKIVTSHVSQAPGPPMIITPIHTVNSNEKPLLSGPRPR